MHASQCSGLQCIQCLYSLSVTFSYSFVLQLWNKIEAANNWTTKSKWDDFWSWWWLQDRWVNSDKLEHSKPFALYSRMVTSDQKTSLRHLRMLCNQIEFKIEAVNYYSLSKNLIPVRICWWNSNNKSWSLLTYFKVLPYSLSSHTIPWDSPAFGLSELFLSITRYGSLSLVQH